MKILITGTSGFIGFHTAKVLLERGDTIIGVDNENDYYDVNLKETRRAILEQYPNFSFYKGDISDFSFLEKVFEAEKPEKVLNLAAQAGVRYSLINPFAYVQTNLVGFHNIIELSKRYAVKNFVYASSSSVYGKNKKQPYSVEDKVDHPMSLYAATKKSNELIAHAYSHLFNLPTTGIRFFTVYGPYGRPDMAYFSFSKKILKKETIDVFNYGKSVRDLMYIDDIVDGVVKCLDNSFQYEVFNLGNDNPITLEYMISLIEKGLGETAEKNYLPAQPGDVDETWADIEYSKKMLHWEPKVRVEEGMEKTMTWLKSYLTK
ncbi:MAG: hypothetical protein ACD_71C00239G0003 [uncultured bacterium (gcode 4)]|uniref:NAD-dependent epimerase/dehydratase domain-containing protein n=1 Tax=uncultured bacterium (gcode 4) TaxID=1234023 RepID=K1Z3I3_9BACT|nr:MAG: hypothetical protein ACD_71C00239G0003 [uncultured bacterium (gcode 4)]